MDKAMHQRLLQITTLSRGSAAVGDALLAGHFDLAPHRADDVCQGAQAAGLIAIWIHACAVRTQLGETGAPAGGYGEAMVRLADALAADPAFRPLD
jgi:hypothetical protein